MSGVLYLLGLGPGDPDLLTIRAAKILAKVDMVAYPQKPDNPSFALQIAGPHLEQKVARMPILLPMQTNREPAKDAYDKAAKHLGQLLDQGKSIAYLCEGDPFFYGSAMYLFSRLAAKYPVEIIPGISSLNAASAAISRPLVSRNEVLKILPGTLDDEILLQELKNTEAAAIVKVGRHFARVKKIIEQAGHGKGAKVVEYATLSNQSLRSLNEIEQEKLPYFSIILCYRGQETWPELDIYQ